MNVHAPALAHALPFNDQAAAFAGDVIGNLSQHPKRLSPKYFYDAAGSELFEQITILPEYYPTRTELGILRDRMRLVVNRYGQAKELPVSKAEEALGMKISHFVPDDPKTVNRANNNGIPLILESPSAPISKSVVKLAASVNGQHKKH